MSGYSKEILKSCSQFNYVCHLLEPERTKLLQMKIEEKFAQSSGKSPLWERLISSTSVHDMNGWQYIASFVNKQPILVFFDETQDSTAVLVNDGGNLTNILAECTGFIFYITNQNCDYVICFNDHDVLIGSGTSEQWIDTLFIMNK